MGGVSSAGTNPMKILPGIQKIPTEKKTTTITSSSTSTSSGPSRTIQSLTKSSSTTSTSYKDGTKTTVTTSRTSMVKPPVKTKTFSEKIFTDSKTTSEDIKTVKSLPPSSPTKTTKTESYSVTTYGNNNLQDGKTTIKTVTIPSSPIKTSKTETVTVTNFQDTIVSTDDQLFDTLIPTSIKEVYGSDIRPEDYISENVSTRYVRTVSSDRPEISFDTYKSTRSSSDTLYATPERKSYVEKDMCTYCQKPILYETKMLLEDANIRCHASCFRLPLGKLLQLLLVNLSPGLLPSLIEEGKKEG
ncbi:Sciellin [Bagarius yarrelli]|uniref:Sciellin n=1 Tax=Bagarius yarrelli TaxID=175774 RepID=A0A556TXN5_BAGYA|nr:Sciellin [Bagarius yarrelli]